MHTCSKCGYPYSAFICEDGYICASCIAPADAAAAIAKVFPNGVPDYLD